MAAIWVVFGHSAMISNNEVASGYRGIEAGTLGCHARMLITIPLPSHMCSMLVISTML